LAFAWARCSCFLTSIRIQMVSAQRLAQWREMVSQPPKKILSTATAEPGYKDNILGIVKAVESLTRNT